MLVMWEIQRGCTAVMPYSSTPASCLVCFSLLCAAPELGQHLVRLLCFCLSAIKACSSVPVAIISWMSECMLLRLVCCLLPLLTSACNQGGHHVAARTVAGTEQYQQSRLLQVAGTINLLDALVGVCVQDIVKSSAGGIPQQPALRLTTPQL